METAKRIVKKALYILIFLVIILIPLKTFYLNKPKLSPLETAISYLKLEQSPRGGEAKKYLFSDFGKIEVLGEKYKEVRWVNEEKKGEEPIFKEEKSTTGENEASVAFIEETNKNEGLVFFDFKLPKEIAFEVELVREGNWKEGYSWKIIKIGSRTLISESEIGKGKQPIEEGGRVFVELIKLKEYSAEDINLPENLKILILEMEYKNESSSPVNFYPFSEWKIVDNNGKEFFPLSPTSARVLPTPTLLGGVLGAGEVKSGYVPFEVEKEVSPEKIIFQNTERKVIYQLTNNFTTDN